MNRPSISVHTLVLNEENFLWYAVASVADYVDKIYIWDTGSTDKTIQLIKELKRRWPEKIEIKEVGKVGKLTLVEMRQKMLDETTTDWIMILDGDEVWWEEGIKKVLSEIGRLPPDVLGMAMPFYNCVGDIFHYQEEAAGKYNIAGRKGHINLRFMRNKKDMKVLGTYPYEYYSVASSQPIQETERIEFTNTHYLHLSHLTRSSKGGKRKEKSEIGISFPLDFYYPETFFRPRPSMITSPWNGLKDLDMVKAMLATPIKKARRRLIANG